MDPNIISSRYPSEKIPVGQNFSDFICSAVGDYAEPFITCATTGAGYTRGEAVEQAKFFAHALRRHSNEIQLETGSVVGVILPNCAEYFSVIMGLIQIGIVPTCINPILTAAPSLSLNSRRNRKYVGGGQRNNDSNLTANSLTASLQEIPCVKQIIILDHSTTQVAEAIAYSEKKIYYYFDLIQDASMFSPNESSQLSSTCSHDETAMIFWSSGTSGKPKGVQLSHRNLLASVISWSTMIPLESNDVIMHPLPFFHIYGFIVLLAMIFYKPCQLVTMTKFIPDLYIEALKKFQPTALALVTPLVTFLASNDQILREDFDKIKITLCGGAPCGTSIIESFRQKTGNDELLREGYGLTETGATGFFVPETLSTLGIGSIGTVASNTEAKIVNVDTGKSLGANEIGEICLRSPAVMKGYFGRVEETSSVLEQDGWFHTGDLGYFTPTDHLFYITGRIKDVIKVNGFQVSPEEIEDTLRKIDKIADVCVIGVPDSTCGEIPKAFIVRKDPEIDEEEIQNFVKTHLAHYKRLKGGVEFVDSIPRSSTGKILRRCLRM